VFPVLDKIDRVLQTKVRCTLIDKMGKYHHGQMVDSWVRVSGGKLRGKVVFQSEEKGEIEVDCNDILDILISGS